MRVAVLAAMLLAAAAGGCMPREPLAEGELDRWWYLQENVWAKAQAKPLAVGGQRLPTKWVFRQERSLIWSTVSIVRAADKLKAGADEIDMAISPDHARMLARILAQGRQAMLDLKAIADPADPPSPRRWSEAVASALVLVEKIARASAEGDTPEGARPDPMGWSAGPVLRMIFDYLDQRAGGGLMAEGARDAATLREVLAQVVLRLGFAVAGKQQRPELQGEVVALMRGPRRPEQLDKALREMLLAELRAAPPGAAGGELRSVLRTVVSGAPAAVEMLESFVRQWHLMDSLTLEFRRLGSAPVVAVTVKTQPNRTVRLAKLHFMQPVIAFRGASRIVVLPEIAQTGEVAVLFEGIDGGATEVRFEGIGYALVRLLALPLASGALREVRVATASAQRGRKMISVAMVMEARDSKDPRRLIAFQDVREMAVAREAFAVSSNVLVKDQTFNYLTPTHRYTFHRVKRADRR